MKIKFSPFELVLAHDWAIAGSVAKKTRTVIFVELTDASGVVGLGEAAPVNSYGEKPDTVLNFFRKVDAARLSFDDIPGSMRYLQEISANDFSAKGAINIALLDGAAKKAGKALYDHLGLGFTESHHVTSYTIGIDTPEKVKLKVREAEPYPILKLKVGGPQDREIFAALREVAPKKIVRIDANEGWKTKEEALTNLEWFALDRYVEFAEQPMPAASNPKDMAWLRERSPMPLYADESYVSAQNVSLCADCFHGVNVKLVKTAGLSGAFEALQAAKKAGLLRMIGCMIESSVLITAAAHLADLADHLDIDTNLLLANDPYAGATGVKAQISFAEAPEKTGLRVKVRPGVTVF